MNRSKNSVRISFAVACATSLVVVLAMPSMAHAQTGCSALPAAAGAVVDVTPEQVGSLQGILDRARAGDTIQLADGLYSLPESLVFRNSGVTLRSKSGNRQDVTTIVC